MAWITFWSSCCQSGQIRRTRQIEQPGRRYHDARSEIQTVLTTAPIISQPAMFFGCSMSGIGANCESDNCYQRIADQNLDFSVARAGSLLVVVRSAFDIHPVRLARP